MTLNIPGAILGKDNGLFKKSPIDGEVDKYEGGKQVPSTDTNTTYSSGDFDHNQLNNFDVDKHREWAASIAQNVHGDNYTNTLPTKQYWESLLDRNANLGNFGVGNINNGAFTYILGSCPHDFNTLVEAKIILFPGVTDGTADIDVESDYGTEGEAYNTHSESDTASTYSITADQVYGLDVSGILTSLAANDYIGLKITNNDASNIRVIGFKLKYT